MFKIMFIESDEWNQANMDDSRAELGFTEAANRLIRNPGYKSRKFVSRANLPLKPTLAIIYSQCSGGSSGLGSPPRRVPAISPRIFVAGEYVLATGNLFVCL
jgi:hypothetical protein